MSTFLSDSEFDKCVKCGYCKTNCPTYLSEGKETFSPRGRLALLGLKLKNKDIYYDIDTCSKCLSCEGDCPVGLSPWKTFSDYKITTFSGKIEALLSRFMTSSAANFSIVVRSGTFLRRSDAKFPKTKTKTYSPRGNGKKVSRGGKIGFFPGCFAETTHKLWKFISKDILQAMGYSVFIPDFICCGAPSYFAGDIEWVEKLAKKIIPMFQDTEYVLAPCDTCVWMLKIIYREILGDKSKKFSEKVFEITDFIASRENNCSFIYEKKEADKKVTAHISCHDVSDGGRIKLLKNLGFDVQTTEFPCCGFGGTLFFKHPKVSKALGKRLCETVKTDLLLTSSPGCALQLSSFKNVKHFLELIYI